MTTVDLSSTLNTYRQKSTEPVERADSLTEENELLLTQLHQVQEELESVFLKSREHEQTIKVLQADLGAQKQATATAAAEAESQRQAKARLEAQAQSQGEQSARETDLEEENELLLQQLHHVQEELESYYLQNQDLNKALKETRQQKQAFERKSRQAGNMLKDVHASLSWKITAPMRFLVRLFKGK